MSYPNPLSQWREIVSTAFPNLSRPQAKVLASWSYGMVIAKACGIVLVSAPKTQGLTADLYAILRTHDAFLQHIQTVERDPEVYAAYRETVAAVWQKALTPIT